MPCKKHEHKCPKCQQTWWCEDYGCIKTRMRRTRYCHGSRCAQDAVKKPEKAKPPVEPGMFDTGDYPHYGGTPPHQADAASREAAEAVRHRVGNQQERVFQALQSLPFRAGTDDDIARITGLPRSSICARRNELVKKGLVRKTNTRKRTQHGGSANVWTVTT